MTNQPLTESIAFEIIIQHFSGQTLKKSQEDIQQLVFNIHVNQGGLPNCVVLNPVKRVLRYLEKFGLAENPQNCYWHIKSVGDMCKRLCDLIDNRNIGDEGEDFEIVSTL